MTIVSQLKDKFFRRKLKNLAQKCAEGPLKHFLLAKVPNSNAKIIDTEFLVADLEMTGLDPKQDMILSIGTTLIQRKSIVHAQAKHQLVFQANADLRNSAPIHRIFEPDLLKGDEIVAVLASFLRQLEGRVLVLHHAALDRKFLNAACKKHFGVELLCLTVDTMFLELKKFQKQGKEPHKLDLANTRLRYKLPAYTAHNAAIDALSTAELLLAQLSYMDPDHQAPMNVLL